MNRFMRSYRALMLLCVTQLVLVLDVTIVGVALPSIRRDLGFSEAGLQWVVGAYVLTFGGSLLVAGRLADTRPRPRLFAAGLAVFGLSSLACGLAPSPAALVGARATQGLGAALASPAALSMITGVFTEPFERRRALAMWSAAAPAVVTIGVAGGLALLGCFVAIERRAADPLLPAGIFRSPAFAGP
jgi:MFS family permease